MLDCDGPEVDICKLCRHASGSVRWCGLYELWIQAPKKKKRKYPGKVKMAGSLAMAVIDQAKAGFPTRSGEEIAMIMAICQKCPSYVSYDERCRKCGCSMPRKIKWATQTCPLHKW